ncbi:hypothetical protein BgAZ_203930 [Babesia gibsoni]|uniref:RRM domain-containing protein n=1 Tax=Babesia gibsoni TaxID=33632 RepID=A0AAD8LRX9_BABGI|nr:hypothetical protein BgAZ_203930 [Babesia gibsoni]
MVDRKASPADDAVADAAPSQPLADNNECCTVHIENIPSQVDEYSLNQVMRHFGKVRQCRVALTDDPKKPAEAYVVFKRPSEAEAAIKANGKLECGGCILKISLWRGSFPSEETLTAKRAEPSSSRDACWFCLSNSQCEDHMISFVSEYSYIAIAKGAITKNHSLVTPIYHYPSAASASDEVLSDMQRLVDCLLDLCLKSGMGGIAFERYMPMSNPSAMHTQIQVIPVPLDRAMEAFDFVNSCEYFCGSRVESLDPSMGTSLTCLNSRMDSLDRSYFYLQAVGRDVGKGKGLVHSHCLWSLGHKGGARRIPITFGRELILHLLPDSAARDIPYLQGKSIESDGNWRKAALDWRNCVTDRKSETKMAHDLTTGIVGLAK